jgi:DNA invertase Pin-like site-specific DNA recombinase
MSPEKVGIYIRVGTQAQVDKGYSLSAQEKLGVELCERNGFSYEMFRGEGASANKETLENRPVLKYLYGR